MKRTDENEIDDYTRMKKLTLYGWLGVPVWFIASIIASIIMVIIMVALQSTGNADFITMNANGNVNLSEQSMSNVMMLSVPFGMLAYPIIWLIFPFARRQNRFVHGYGIKDLKERLHTKTTKSAWFKGISLGILCGLITTVGMTLLSILANPILKNHNQDQTTTAMVVKAAESLKTGAVSSSAYWLSLLMVICAFIIGPICEELVFRGLIGMSFRDSNMFRSLSDKTRMIIICLLSGALFGLMHFQPGDTVVSMITMLFTGLIGAWFSWLALYKFNTVVPTMAAHVTYNSIAVLLTLLLGI